MAAFSGSVPSLPPSAPSVAATTSTEAANPYYIPTPKPDITVGLAHESFEPQQQRCLIMQQMSGSILSDPHAAEMGLRFPFLAVEAKGLSLSGSLVVAQNQAAISGASMLVILQDLSNQADKCVITAANSGSASQETPALCISIVTMGPIHDMGVHFMDGDASFMYCFKTYRTTLESDARRFVASLSRILRWGRGRHKEGVVRRLDRVLVSA
jgi:hypothetical protein